MPLTCDQIECLVTAVLAVNRYPPEKVWNVLPRLREAGLIEPAAVVRDDLGTLTVKLASSGYDRGMLTGMMAERLQGLMKAVDDSTLEELSEALRVGDREAGIDVLCKVRGIGPTVARTAWMLLVS